MLRNENAHSLDTVLPFALAFYDHIILSERSRQCPVSTKWLPTPPSPAGKAALARPRPFHPSPSPSLQPIPSRARSFNKARDRPVGRSTRHLLRRANPTRESRSPIATAAKLAPPQFRGTWQPNRPYTLRSRKGKGKRTTREGRGEGGSIAI